MTQIKKFPSVLFSLCFALVLNIFSSAQSQTLAGNPGVIWSDSPAGNYDQADLWAFPVWGGSVGIPNSSSNAFIFNGDLSVTNGGNFNPNQLVLGWEPTHTGKFTQTGGTVRTESWTRVGWSGNTQLNQSGGSFSASDLMVGWINFENPGTPAAIGTVNQTGGNFETRGIAYVGLQGGTGTVNVSAGTNTSTRMIVGWVGGGNGTVNLTGGRMQAGETTFVGFDGGTGVLNISKGEYLAQGNSSSGFPGFGSFRIGDWGVGTGTVNLSSNGVITANQYTAVGGWGNGTLNITGGTFNQTSGGVVLGDRPPNVTDWTGTGVVNQSGGTVNADAVLLQQGTYNLNGGSLYTFAVADTSTTANGVFNFNGGWLLARGNHADFLTADKVEIKAGGAIINTAGFDVSINRGMTGSGFLTKGGTGTLRLTGANTYAGYTTVVDGKLVVSGSVSSTNSGAYVIVESANTNNPVAPEIEVVDGAALTLAGPFFAFGWQPNSSGKFTQSGGAVSVTNGQMILADSANSVGMAVISGGTLNVAKTTVVGRVGSGTLNISGGTMNAGTDGLGSFRIGDFVGSTGVGIMNLSGTAVVNAPSYTAVGGLGSGTLNISGGTWNSPDDIVLGDRPPNVTDWTGTGVVNQTGGNVNARAVFLQAGTYNLSGGVLAVAAVGDTKAEANGVFNFNGGTLQATVNHADFLMADTVEIKSGGATIDTADKEVWINKGMTGAGGLTKKGTGMLKLAGLNSYRGSTTVQEGTLRVETANFIADATPATLTVAFAAAPADGQLAIFPGTLNGNPTVSFTGLASGQTGVFSPLSGKATFTTTSTGVSFAAWSGNQTLTSALLGKYAIGGASGPSASSVAPVLTSTGGVITLSALVRTNASATSFAVVGEYSTNLTTWLALTSNPAGVPSADTNGVPTGFQRKTFSVPVGSESKKFLRLKSTL